MNKRNNYTHFERISKGKAVEEEAEKWDFLFTLDLTFTKIINKIF